MHSKIKITAGVVSGELAVPSGKESYRGCVALEAAHFSTLVLSISGTRLQTVHRRGLPPPVGGSCYHHAALHGLLLEFEECEWIRSQNHPKRSLLQRRSALKWRVGEIRLRRMTCFLEKIRPWYKKKRHDLEDSIWRSKRINLLAFTCML